MTVVDPFLIPLPDVEDLPVVSEIDTNLWQGRYPGERGFEPFFRHILNLSPWQPYAVAPDVEVLRVELHDTTTVPPVEILDQLAAWVNDRRQQGPTLVHCHAGLNRSGLVVALSLMRRGQTADAAIALLRAKRHPHVLFNRWFETWLRHVE